MKTIQEKIVKAYSSNDLDTLQEVFVRQKLSDPLFTTEVEQWNYLHRSLLYFNPSVEIINFFIKLGIDINAQDIYGMTPLHYAMQAKNVDGAIALLNAGADPNIPDKKNLIPLRMCIRYPERLDLLELMLKNGGNVHYFDGNNYLLEAIKEFKGNDPDPKYRKFIKKLEEYA